MENEILGDGRFGRVFSLHGEWSNDLHEFFVNEGFHALVVCRPDGDERESLDFLEQVPWLKSFKLLDMLTKDISGLHFLTELRYLYMGDYSGKPIDFTRFPHLEECYMEFVKGRASVAQCTQLTNLELQHYCFKDLSPLAPLRQLSRLWCSQGSLGDISQINAFSNLTDLSLMLLRNLKDIRPLSDLKSLEKLDLQCCKGIGRLDALSSLSALRALSIVDCGEIESLAPLLDCGNLEELYFGGATKILDGDMSVLLRMPNLKTVMFANRKTYNLKREDIPAFFN